MDNSSLPRCTKTMSLLTVSRNHKVLSPQHLVSNHARIEFHCCGFYLEYRALLPVGLWRLNHKLSTFYAVMYKVIKCQPFDRKNPSIQGNETTSMRERLPEGENPQSSVMRIQSFRNVWVLINEAGIRTSMQCVITPKP